MLLQRTLDGRHAGALHPALAMRAAARIASMLALLTSPAAAQMLAVADPPGGRASASPVEMEARAREMQNSVARERAMGESVIRLVRRAELLLTSPLLSDEDRRDVRRRIVRSALTEIRHSRIRLASGIELAVAEVGPADGEPVLFLHGLTDSWFAFTPVIDRLPSNIRAIVPTQRGHGLSNRPECCYALTDLAGDAVELLDALGIERVTVVGHSLGSFIARRVAIDHPERVTRLMLVGSGIDPVTDATREFVGVVNSLEDPIDPQFVREFQASTAYQPLQPAFLDRVTAESLQVPVRVWQGAVNGMVAQDAAGDATRISAPTLILSGAHDQIWRPQDAQALARAIPGARLVMYDDAGHAPHWEHPDRFTRDLLDFLRN